MALVINRAREACAGRLLDKCVVGYLRKAVGLYGPTREYPQHILIGLASNGPRDPYLDRLRSHLQATDAVGGPYATTNATDITYTTPLPDPYLSI